MSVLSKKHFHDEEAAFAKVEALLWPKGPVCPYCGCMGRIYVLKGVRSKPSKKNPEGIERFGLKKCGDCRKQFTVRMKTIFESSHIPLHKWLQAIHLLCASKKGISSHQLHRILEITYEAAWFMSHRIREAMHTGSLAVPSEPLGGEGKIIEADETFLAKKKGAAKKRGYYKVEHGKGEYVRGDAHTTTLEGYFSIFERGMKGVYQHCAEKHLHRYLAEFDFRYNNWIANGIGDEERAEKALKGFKGKQLTYGGPHAVAQA